MVLWYIGTEARTSWIDASVYQKPIATKFNSTSNGTFPAVIGQDGLGQTQLFEHEVGQIKLIKMVVQQQLHHL